MGECDLDKCRRWGGCGEGGSSGLVLVGSDGARYGVTQFHVSSDKASSSTGGVSYEVRWMAC